MAIPVDYLPRHLDLTLQSALTGAPVLVLDGPRGVGKTTSARRLARSVIMLPRDLDQLRADAEGYLRALPAPVLVDEWQLAGTDLLWTIKRIVDDDPAPGRFILTGSVEPAAYGPTYPLTGRGARYVMRPMTRAELAGRGGETTLVQSLVAGNEWVASAGAPSAFDLDWLAQPGFPAARQLPDPTFFLDAYAAVVAQRGGDEGRDASRVLRTLRVLATLTGQAVPDQRVWEAADINKVTWKHYDDLLLRAHLSVPTPAFSSNRLARLTAYPKRFLADTAMALALSDLAVSDLRANHSVAGRYLESFVMQQLRPQVDLVRGALLHLRTSAGEREVDAVVETAAGLVGIEVKLGTHPGPADARTLEWLRDQQGERFLLGLVVHSGRDSYPLGERLWAVPIAALTQPVHR